MDIKEKIEEIIEAIKKDPSIGELFKKEPIKAVEKVLGIDLPDEIIEKIIDGVKAKMGIDSVAGALGALKKLF